MNTTSTRLPSPGLFRRLAGVVYDALGLLAVLCLATAVALPVTHGLAIAPENPVFQVYLMAIAFLYLGWFWTRAGQTVAMRAWRLRVVDVHGDLIAWRRALARFVAALLPVLPVLLLLGLVPLENQWAAALILGAWLCGFLWVAVDKENRAWHDILSGTRVVQDPKP
jgi:uncharacterized RDD family membrane protein YckC